MTFEPSEHYYEDIVLQLSVVRRLKMYLGCVNFLGGDKIWYTFTCLICQMPKSHIENLGSF